MRKNYARVRRCLGCTFRYECRMSPLRRNSSSHFVFFPELLNEASLPVLFPELYFYP